MQHRTEQSSASTEEQKHYVDYRLDWKCDPLQLSPPLNTLFYYVKCSAAYISALQLNKKSNIVNCLSLNAKTSSIQQFRCVKPILMLR